ncbi:MAG: ribosomal protein S18-alanine N-acetyltransferase [Pseudomonadota bacterium]
MKLEDLVTVGKIERENLTSWSLSSLQQELEVRQGSCFVAEASDHGIVGWCACRKIWPEAELLKIAVFEREKTKGIGSFLLQHLMKEVQGEKFSVLFLEVRSQNMTALKFYNNHGFRQVGMRRAYYSDPKDDALILRKNIC